MRILFAAKVKFFRNNVEPADTHTDIHRNFRTSGFAKSRRRGALYSKFTIYAFRREASSFLAAPTLLMLMVMTLLMMMKTTTMTIRPCFLGVLLLPPAGRPPKKLWWKKLTAENNNKIMPPPPSPVWHGAADFWLPASLAGGRK